MPVLSARPRFVLIVRSYSKMAPVSLELHSTLVQEFHFFYLFQGKQAFYPLHAFRQFNQLDLQPNSPRDAPPKLTVSYQCKERIRLNIAWSRETLGNGKGLRNKINYKHVSYLWNFFNQNISSRSTVERVVKFIFIRLLFVSSTTSNYLILDKFRYNTI